MCNIMCHRVFVVVLFLATTNGLCQRHASTHLQSDVQCSPCFSDMVTSYACTTANMCRVPRSAFCTGATHVDTLSMCTLSSTTGDMTTVPSLVWSTKKTDVGQPVDNWNAAAECSRTGSCGGTVCTSPTSEDLFRVCFQKYIVNHMGDFHRTISSDTPVHYAVCSAVVMLWLTLQVFCVWACRVLLILVSNLIEICARLGCLRCNPYKHGCRVW